jgi:hypothetical protein
VKTPSLKKEVKEALKCADFESVARLALNDRKVFSALISLSFDKEDSLSWRAVEAIGISAGAVAKSDAAFVRNVVQRLLWSMRDESGAIGWNAPEMLGEIVIRSPESFADIVLIIPSFFEEDVFQRGVIWAMGRIAGSGIDPGQETSDIIMQSLDHKDASVRGLAVWTGLQLKDDRIKEKIRTMADDNGRFTIYENHTLTTKIVGEMARRIEDDK